MTSGPETQGIAANRGQFALLLGAGVLAVMITGAERSVLPVLGREEFGVSSNTATLSFIIAFGIAKAMGDFVAGDLAGRIGRKRVLLLGWVAALPVAPMILAAPAWGWVVAANVLLGTASAFIWSSSVVMRLDLAGEKRRGLAMGLSGLGPIFLGLTALAAGWLAHRFGPRPAPFLIAVAASIAGMLLVIPVRDTAGKAAAEEDGNGPPDDPSESAPDGVASRFAWATWKKPELMAANQAGLALNMTDGVVWGLFPLFLTSHGLGLREIGWIAGAYPIVVGLVEGATGPLSDRWGRRPLIVGGMLLVSAGLVAFASASGLTAWLVLAAIMGVGYASAFPTLSAHIGDVVAARSRPAAIGTYRMWRDIGHAVGGLTAGLLADLMGFRWAMRIVAALVVVSAGVAWWRLTRRRV